MNKIKLIELIKSGLNKEKNKSKFYGKMKKLCKNERVSQLFEALESWEKTHVEIVEKIEKKLFDSKEEFQRDISEQEEYINAILLDYDDIEELAEKDNCENAVFAAMHSEKNAILFFGMVKDMIPDEYKGTIDKILFEEKEHLNYLYRIQQEVEKSSGKNEN